jgi:hypothetical protein
MANISSSSDQIVFPKLGNQWCTVLSLRRCIRPNEPWETALQEEIAPMTTIKSRETKHLRSGDRKSESVQECQRAMQQPQYDSTVPSSAALTFNQTAALSNYQSSNDRHRHLLDILLNERRRCRIQLDALEQQRSRLINYQDPHFSASSVCAGQRPPTTSVPVRFESRMSSAAITPSPSHGRDPHNRHPPLNLQNWAGFPTSRASSAGASQFWSSTRGMVEDADYPMQRRQRRELPFLEERKPDGTKSVKGEFHRSQEGRYL